MKRSNDPIFWSLFGAGGMLAALIGPALVLVTGVLVSPGPMQYQNMLGFAHHWLGKIVIFAIIVLFLWHAALRIFHMLHDFGIHAGTGARVVCFGLSLLCTIAAAWWLLAIGS